MPPIVKQTAPHILISMIVAPIMLGLFAWAGSSILGNREVTVLVPAITKKLDEISQQLHEQSRDQDALLLLVYKNRQDVAIIKTIIKSKKYEK